MKNARLLSLGFVFALVWGLPLSAQQLSLFTKYREAATILNPAALEADYLTSEGDYNLTIGLSIRQQWTNIENSPQTQTARLSYVLDNGGFATLTTGAYLVNDQTGPTGYSGAYGRIGVLLGRDPEYAGVSIGLTAGYVGYRVRGSEIVLRDPNDPLGGIDSGQGSPDVGLGIYGYTSAGDDHMFYGGLSAPQMLGLDVTFQNDNGMYDVNRLRHYYATAGWYWFTGSDSWLEVSSWVKYVENAPLNADINVRYQLPRAPYIGMGISTAGTFHFEAGVNVGQSDRSDTNFRIGYGYDYGFTSVGPNFGGTHELQVAVALAR